MYIYGYRRPFTQYIVSQQDYAIVPVESLLDSYQDCCPNLVVTLSQLDPILDLYQDCALVPIRLCHCPIGSAIGFVPLYHCLIVPTGMYHCPIGFAIGFVIQMRKTRQGEKRTVPHW